MSLTYSEKVDALRELGIDFSSKNCSKRGECFRFHGATKAMPSEAELEAALAQRSTHLAVAAEVAKIRAAREAEQAALDEAEARRRLGL